MRQEIEEAILQIDIRMAAMRAVVQFGEGRGVLGLELSRYLDDLHEELQAERDRLQTKLERIGHDVHHAGTSSPSRKAASVGGPQE